jgi:geranylgeranyl pyrophosphate synthase
MIEEYINKLTRNIDQSLIQNIDPGRGILEEAIYYALSIKCKRLRPLLFLSLVDAFKLSALSYLDIACAIECIHTYSLIHDDLPSMDNDDYRRGMPTVHKKFNDAIALLAGDTLLTLAFERISKSDVNASKLINILKILTTGIGLNGMAGGQALDLQFDGNGNNILEIHRKKTAELIKASLLTAAEIIDLHPHEKKTLAEAGETIGIAFQLADDLLDIEGDEQEVGKKLNKDRENMSPNSVLYYGIDYVRKEIDGMYKETVELLKNLNIDFPPFLYLIKKMVYRSK